VRCSIATVRDAVDGVDVRAPTLNELAALGVERFQYRRWPREDDVERERGFAGARDPVMT